MPAFAAGPSLAKSATRMPEDLERLNCCCRDAVDRASADPDVGVSRLAGGDDLIGHSDYKGGRYGKPDVLNLHTLYGHRGHAHYLSFDVRKRAAGVAGADPGVGLDQVRV